MNPYLITVSQKLKHKTCSDELKRYVKKYNLKRKQQGKGKKTMKYKITRKKEQSKTKQKDKTKENEEGTSYEPGIGRIESNAPFIQSILASPKDPKESLKWLKSKSVNFQKKDKIYKDKSKVTKTLFTTWRRQCLLRILILCKYQSLKPTLTGLIHIFSFM